jgi:hypothetical protein
MGAVKAKEKKFKNSDWNLLTDDVIKLIFLFTDKSDMINLAYPIILQIL